MGALPGVAVVLPGAGSDDVFVRTAFGPALAALGVRLVAPVPRRGADVVAGYRAALDAAAAAAAGPLLVGGVSLGAHVAAVWAGDRAGDPSGPPGSAAGAGQVAGLLLALPAWTGPPGGAPAALAARLTAARVRSSGLDAALAAARAGVPGWLAAELERAWRGYGRGLADALEAAADTPGPTAAALAGLAVPAGIAALADDPVHPAAVAAGWAGALPAAAVVTSRLPTVGADPATLGRAAVLAWLRARAAAG